MLAEAYRRRACRPVGGSRGAPRMRSAVPKGDGLQKKHDGEFVVHRNFETASCHEIANF
jgi:hypothetical protein